METATSKRDGTSTPHLRILKQKNWCGCKTFMALPTVLKPKKRYVILRKYRKRLLKHLEEDYDPFIDNTEFHQKQKALKEEKKRPVVIITEEKNLKKSNEMPNTYFRVIVDTMVLLSVVLTVYVNPNWIVVNRIYRS